MATIFWRVMAEKDSAVQRYTSKKQALDAAEKKAKVSKSTQYVLELVAGYEILPPSPIVVEPFPPKPAPVGAIDDDDESEDTEEDPEDSSQPY